MSGSKNPWLASAATGATGETYEIRAVADFLKVPDERRRICLREFHSWLMLQEQVTKLICAGGDDLEAPVDPASLHWENEVFRWHDDGLAVMSVQLVERAQPDGNVPASDRDRQREGHDL